VKRALVVGLAGLAGTVGYAFFDLRRAMFAWTAAFGLGMATALAAMILVFVFHLAHAQWWLAVRRPLVACAATIPLYVVFFLPIAATLPAVHVTSTIEHQRIWHERSFFLARSAFYLVTWSILAMLTRRNDARRFAAPGILVIAFTSLFASFDWLMSLEPDWVSDVYGLTVLSAGAVSAMATVAVAARKTEGVTPDHAHAIGRLLLTTILVEGYIAFFQLLIVWLADLPRDVGFFVARSAGSWAIVTGLLVALKLGVPFVLLLSRALKRRAWAVAGIGAWLVVMSALEFAWLVVPSSGGRLSWLDALPFFAVIGLSCAYAMRVGETPAEEPALREALRYRSP